MVCVNSSLYPFPRPKCALLSSMSCKTIIKSTAKGHKYIQLLTLTLTSSLPLTRTHYHNHSENYSQPHIAIVPFRIVPCCPQKPYLNTKTLPNKPFLRFKMTCIFKKYYVWRNSRDRKRRHAEVSKNSVLEGSGTKKTYFWALHRVLSSKYECITEDSLLADKLILEQKRKISQTSISKN